jgi:hypothetical protein
LDKYGWESIQKDFRREINRRHERIESPTMDQLHAELENFESIC